MTESNRKWWVLVGSCVGLFLLMLDGTVVTLALPSIQRELDSTNAQLQWMLNGYLLTLAVLVVTGGRLGDMYGRKKIFLISLGVFALGSVVAATAPSSEVLIAARIIQGAGGAGMVTLSLAIVSHAFSEEEQTKALGIWAGVSALAMATGPLIGGAIVENASWRWIFWINLPFVIAGGVITAIAARESSDREASTKVDVWGLITVTIGITGVVLALIQSKPWGILSLPTLLSFFIGLGSLYAFWRIEHRVANPIIEFSLFRNRPYFGANAAAFGIVFCFWVLLFFFPQYFQNVLDYEPLVSGLMILPLVVPMMIISPFGGKLVGRFGTKEVMTVGMLLAVIGVGGLTQISASTAYEDVFPFLLMIGIALSLVYAPMSAAAMSAMPRSKAGIASGVLAMNRMMAGAFGLALVGGLFQHFEVNKREEIVTQHSSLSSEQVKDLDGLLAGSPTAKAAVADQSASSAAQIENALRETFTFALANIMWVLILVAAVATILTWLFVQNKKPEEAVEHEHKHHFRHRAPT